MDYASSKLESAVGAFATVWAKFVKTIQLPAVSDVCVFEGFEDLKYYPTRIERVSGRYPGRMFTAYGKKNVLAVRDAYSRIDASLKKRVSFFVDIDFDFDRVVDLKDDLTYVTPVYAIENFYAPAEVFERILIEEFRLVEDEDQGERDRLISLYQGWLDRFCDVLLPYCAVLLLAKRSGCENTVVCAEGLKKDFFKKVINIRWEGNVPVFDVLVSATDLHSIWSDFPVFRKSDVDSAVSEMTACLGKVGSVRGKFLLPFLVSVLSRMVEDSNRRSGWMFFSKRRRCAFSINNATDVVSILSRFAITPPCLVEFIKGIEWS